MVEKYNMEFKYLLKDIMFSCTKISDAFDRVRIMQWVRKLCEQNDKILEYVRIRNEYMHFLRILLNQEKIYFCMPFKDEPPKMATLAPLPEILSNSLHAKCANLPPIGPIRPVLLHKSPDGRAYMTIKRVPDGGIFGYLAVTPRMPEQ